MMLLIRLPVLGYQAVCGETKRYTTRADCVTKLQIARFTSIGRFLARPLFHPPRGDRARTRLALCFILGANSPAASPPGLAFWQSMAASTSLLFRADFHLMLQIGHTCLFRATSSRLQPCLSFEPLLNL
eukprot:3731703-Pleurochrysis_carterae.AAC.1